MSNFIKKNNKIICIIYLIQCSFYNYKMYLTSIIYILHHSNNISINNIVSVMMEETEIDTADKKNIFKRTIQYLNLIYLLVITFYNRVIIK